MKNKQLALETKRLILRPLEISDAPAVQKYCSDRRIAETTGPSIQHPYPEGKALAWISEVLAPTENKRRIDFAIVLKSTNELIGYIGLFLDLPNDKTEIGYWIAVDFWNQGFATEAAKPLMEYAFKNLNLNKVTARHARLNPASGAVLLKLGMKKEGSLRQNFKKLGVTHDEEVYGLLREDYAKK